MKKTTVIGLGKTGLSCARFLQHQGIPFSINDSREHPPELDILQREMPEVPLYLGKFDEDLLLSSDEVIVSQGVSLLEPCLQKCKQKGIPLKGDIELFSLVHQSPCAGITGSNGKSTVTTLVGEMAKSAGIEVGVGGNLGVPALDLLTDKEPDLYVLELSNFQLEVTSSLHLVAGCILNLSPDHLDRYVSYEDYIAAKQRIYQHCKVAVVNRDDPNTWVKQGRVERIISVGLDEPKEDQFGLRLVGKDWYLAYGDENWLNARELKIHGRQNWFNALAALAMGQALGFSKESMKKTLREFKGLRHRCELVKVANGVEFYNDSKGTNVGATIAAIEGIGTTLKGKIILLAGGLGKGADFSDLQNPVSRYVRNVVLYGQDAKLIGDALASVTDPVFVNDFQSAFNAATSLAQKGDAVLLSPACASWDMFENFEHRGNMFCQLVEAYHHV